MIHRVIILPIFAMLVMPCVANAQDSGYVPPPMFEDLTPPMVRPNTVTGNIVEPKVSTQEPVSPAAPVAPTATEGPKFMEPIIERRSSPAKAAVKEPVKPVAPAPVVEQPTQKADVKLPAPPRKPSAPTSVTLPKEEKQIAETPKEIPVPIEQPVISAPQPAKPAPASKVTSKGVVQGPKTMPAVPTQEVEKDAGFIDLTAPLPGKTIMQRHQEQFKKQKEAREEKKNIKEAELHNVKNDNAPSIFDASETGVLKKILPYQPGQVDLAEPDLMVIGTGVLNEMKKKDDWRIQIRSYATPQGSGVSSDKRIALSRAIALRKSLVEQGVRPSHIDVRAEGNKDGADRVDVYLYSPAEKTEIF